MKTILIITAISMLLVSCIPHLKHDEYLKCKFKDGWRVVPDNKIEGKIDGVWLFKDGYAKNCVVLKTTEVN